MKKRQQKPRRQYTGTQQVSIANNGQTVTASEHQSAAEMVPTER